MSCRLIEAVAVRIGLCLQHQFVQLADTKRAALPTGEDFGLEQEAATDVDDNLQRAL